MKLTISPLQDIHGESLRGFSCGDDDLNDFACNDAARLQGRNVVQTYVACEFGRAPIVIGYVSLLNDAVKLKSRERKTLDLDHDDHPIIPALKIARLAVAADLQRGKGIGTQLVRFAYLTGLEIAPMSGCRLLTLDAYPQSIAFYERLGFVRNLETQSERPSMRFDLFAKAPRPWLGLVGM